MNVFCINGPVWRKLGRAFLLQTPMGPPGPDPRFRGMSPLVLAAFSFSTSSLVGLLVWVAIACVVVWGVLALIKWSGVAIPQPVIIVFWCFVAIGLILLMAKFFGLMV